MISRERYETSLIGILLACIDSGDSEALARNWMTFRRAWIPTDFQHAKPRAIFEVLLERADQTGGVLVGPAERVFDLITQRLGEGIRETLVEAIENAFSSSGAHAQHYAQEFLDVAVGESIDQAVREIASAKGMSSEDRLTSMGEVMAQARARLGVLNGSSPEEDVDYAVGVALGEIQRKILPTRIGGLDEIIGGLEAGRLYVVSGPTGGGKTATALQIVRNVVRHDEAVEVLYAALEESTGQVSLRLLGNVASVNTSTAAAALTEEERARVEDVRYELLDLRRRCELIGPARCPTVEDLSTIAEQKRADKGLSLIVVDYLQLLNKNTGEQGDAARITHITNSLKLLGLRLDVPVLAVSQFSRAAAAEKDPGLHHLKGSSSIEQDADNVVMISAWIDEDTGVEDEGYLRMSVKKQRAGARGSSKLQFVREYGQVLDPLPPFCGHGHGDVELLS